MSRFAIRSMKPKSLQIILLSGLAASLLWAPLSYAQSGPFVDCNCLAKLPQLQTNGCLGVVPDLCAIGTNCFRSTAVPPLPLSCNQTPVPGTIFGPGTHPITLTVTDSQVVEVSSFKDALKTLSDYYFSAVNTPGTEDNNTYLIKNLITTYQQNKSEDYKDIIYILLTDGSFSIERSLTKDLGTDYFSEYDFKDHDKIAEFFEKTGLVINGDKIDMKNGKEGKMVLIGFYNSKNNYNFENAAYQVFKAIYNGCKIEFLP